MTVSLVLSLLLSAAQPTEGDMNNESSNMVSRQATFDDDEEICRRKTIEHPKMPNRTKTVKICKTREEWREMATKR